MNRLTRKGESRMYVQNSADAGEVRKIIHGMDEFEADYMPDEWVASWEAYPQTVYTGKFDDLDIDELINRCWKTGIRCWVYDAG